MFIKLVAIDIDDILLNEKRGVAKEVKEVITAAVAKGASIVLYIDHLLSGVREQLNELNLFQNSDYVITHNGALAQQTKSGEIIARHELTHENFLEIEVMTRRVGSHLHSIDGKAVYTPNRGISAYMIREAGLVKMPLKHQTPEKMALDMNIVGMMAIDEPEILDAAIARLPQTFRDKYTAVKSAPYYFEALNKEASEGTAVANLAQHLGIDRDEVMVIEGNENDLPMIEYAGLGVVTGDAVSLVKEVTNAITLLSDEHGVAEAIKKYVLQ